MAGLVPEVETKATGEISSGEIQTPVEATAIHAAAVGAISHSLNQAGHPKTPEEVSATGGPGTVLAQIAAENVGAQVVDSGADHLKKGIENFGGDIGGSKRMYQVSGRPGHGIAMRRMSERVLGKGIPARIRHLLFRQKKTR